MWQRLLRHTRIPTGLLVWCQKRDSGHLRYKCHHWMPQILGQEEEHTDVITAGGPDPALKDRGAGAAKAAGCLGKMSSAQGRCLARCQERAGLPAFPVGNEKHQRAAAGIAVAAAAGCRDKVWHGAPQPSPAAACCPSQPTPSTLRQAGNPPPVPPKSFPPAFPVMLGGAVPSGQGCRGIPSPGPSCLGSCVVSGRSKGCARL